MNAFLKLTNGFKISNNRFINGIKVGTLDLTRLYLVVKLGIADQFNNVRVDILTANDVQSTNRNVRHYVEDAIVDFFLLKLR